MKFAIISVGFGGDLNIELIEKFPWSMTFAIILVGFGGDLNFELIENIPWGTPFAEFSTL